MVTNIISGQHSSTSKFWASCHVPNIGECTQWGQTEDEALDNLRQFIELHYDELWPSVEAANPRYGKQDCTACRYCETSFVEGFGLVDWWLHVPTEKKHVQHISVIGRYGEDIPDYWSWPIFMFEKAAHYKHAFSFSTDKHAMKIWLKNKDTI